MTGTLIAAVLDGSDLGGLMQQLYDELSHLLGNIPSDLSNLTQQLIDQLQQHQSINATQMTSFGAIAAALIGIGALFFLRRRSRNKVTR